MDLFKIELSESEKAASPSIASVREHTARSIGRAFGGGGRQAEASQSVVPRAAASPKSKVTVGGGDAEKVGEEFNEF
jgi:hypothetical protein